MVMTTAPPPSRTLAAHIRRWRDAVLDYDLLVDDRRQELDRAVAAFHDAVRERDRTARHLQQLLDLR
jgi:predicted sulfurtransferase